MFFTGIACGDQHGYFQTGVLFTYFKHPSPHFKPSCFETLNPISFGYTTLKWQPFEPMETLPARSASELQSIYSYPILRTVYSPLNTGLLSSVNVTTRPAWSTYGGFTSTDHRQSLQARHLDCEPRFCDQACPLQFSNASNAAMTVLIHGSASDNSRHDRKSGNSAMQS